jgi:aspartate kinase
MKHAQKIRRVVSKFGGTSMGDAACMKRSAEVSVKQGASIVVVSATSGTTNQLIDIGQTAQSGKWLECEKLIQKLQDRHLQIAKDVGCLKELDPSLNLLFEELISLSKGIFYLKDLSPKALDALMSLGERLSSTIFVYSMQQALKNLGSSQQALFLDVREVLATDDQFGKAKPLTNLIVQRCQEKLRPQIQAGAVFVTQGFVGKSEEDGATTTLGRGGSDYTAAILAEGIGADILEIWTDVAGIATTDPRICSEAKMIDEISFREASELATFGAKVLHPATLLPAVRQNIPVFVGSSFDAEQKGTWVKKEVQSQPLIRAMALRKKQILLTLSTPEMLYAHGFLAKIFKVFDDHKVSVDAITTSEISVSMTVDETTVSNKRLFHDLSQFADVQVEENLTLISLIGNNINHTPGLSKKIFSAIDNINVRMICLGASKHNFCFLVAESNGIEAIQRIHKAFIQ